MVYYVFLRCICFDGGRLLVLVSRLLCSGDAGMQNDVSGVPFCFWPENLCLLEAFETHLVPPLDLQNRLVGMQMTTVYSHSFAKLPKYRWGTKAR